MTHHHRVRRKRTRLGGFDRFADDDDGGRFDARKKRRSVCGTRDTLMLLNRDDHRDRFDVAHHLSRRRNEWESAAEPLDDAAAHPRGDCHSDQARPLNAVQRQRRSFSRLLQTHSSASSTEDDVGSTPLILSRLRSSQVGIPLSKPSPSDLSIIGQCFSSPIIGEDRVELIQRLRKMISTLRSQGNAVDRTMLLLARWMSSIGSSREFPPPTSLSALASTSPARGGALAKDPRRASTKRRFSSTAIDDAHHQRVLTRPDDDHSNGGKRPAAYGGGAHVSPSSTTTATEGRGGGEGPTPLSISRKRPARITMIPSSPPPTSSNEDAASTSASTPRRNDQHKRRRVEKTGDTSVSMEEDVHASPPTAMTTTPENPSIAMEMSGEDESTIAPPSWTTHTIEPLHRPPPTRRWTTDDGIVVEPT